MFTLCKDKGQPISLLLVYLQLTLIISIIIVPLVDDGIYGNGSFPTRRNAIRMINYLFLPPLNILLDFVQSTYPVCLSPMISSRCPRPMGTRLSTALMPVCMGSFTEIRGMMPGAFRPTLSLALDTMDPCIHFTTSPEVDT